MPWHEHKIGKAERDRCSESVADNSELGNERNAKNEVGDTLDHDDDRQNLMFAEAEQNASGSGLRQHERERNNHDHQHRVAMRNVAGTHPNADDVLAENNQDGSDGKNEERAHAVTGDINFAHAIEVASGLRLT